MLTFAYTLLCFSWLFADSFGASVSFIQKCDLNDKDCLQKSSQIAIPYFADGLPDIGMPPFDPLTLDEITWDEGGLKLVFPDFIVTGQKNCQFKSVEFNKNEEVINLELECPIEANGNYVASGKLLGVPVEGEGPFQIKSDKVYLAVKGDLKTVTGIDGQNYWSAHITLVSFEFFEKTSLKFDNLFNGDQEKAGPVQAVLEASWKEILQTFGNQILSQVLKQIDSRLAIFLAAVPASELQI